MINLILLVKKRKLIQVLKNIIHLKKNKKYLKMIIRILMWKFKNRKMLIGMNLEHMNLKIEYLNF